MARNTKLVAMTVLLWKIWGYGESNSYVTDNVTWPWKVKVVTKHIGVTTLTFQGHVTLSVT